MFFIGKLYQQKLIFPQLQQADPIHYDNCSNGEYYFDKTAQYLFVCISGRGKA